MNVMPNVTLSDNKLQLSFSRIAACTSLSHHQLLSWTDENDQTCWTLEKNSEVDDSMCAA